MLVYDVDKSRTLQLNEINQFFSDHFQDMFEAGTVTAIIKTVHPNVLNVRLLLEAPRKCLLLGACARMVSRVR